MIVVERWHKLVCMLSLSRSCNALSRHASDTSRPPRRTASSGAARPAALRMVSPPRLPRKRLHFVSRLFFLPMARTKLFSCVSWPYYAIWKDTSLRFNVVTCSGMFHEMPHNLSNIMVVSYLYLYTSHDLFFRLHYLEMPPIGRDRRSTWIYRRLLRSYIWMMVFVMWARGVRRHWW